MSPLPSSQKPQQVGLRPAAVTIWGLSGSLCGVGGRAGGVGETGELGDNPSLGKSRCGLIRDIRVKVTSGFEHKMVSEDDCLTEPPNSCYLIYYDCYHTY